MIIFNLALLYLQEVGIQSILHQFIYFFDVASFNIALFLFVVILYNKVQLANIS